LAHLAGAKLPADRVLDGRDIAHLLTEPAQAKSPHEALYYYSYIHLQAVRSGRWKLVRPRPANPKWCSWSARMTEAVDDWQLYDLTEDISEQRNVAKERPAVVMRLRGLLEKGRREIGDYNLIGTGQRFFDTGPRRSESQTWLQHSDAQSRENLPK
jgi:arylsulfatase A-like enzyme